jgi:monoamine oxidase
VGVGLGRNGVPDVLAAPTPRLAGNVSADVVIVGAGLAGLSAARQIKQRNATLSVIVLEARDRVGGRTLNHSLGIGSKVIEVGGQWVGPLPGQPSNNAQAFDPTPQSEIYNLATAMGVATYPTFNAGSTLDYSQGHLTAYVPGPAPFNRIPASNPSAANAGFAENTIDTMASPKNPPFGSNFNPAAPYSHPMAEAWDSQTFETWMQQNLAPPNQAVNSAAYELINLGIEAVFAAEPRDLSLLHVLFYVASAGSFENLVNTAGGAQDSRFVGGSQQISINLANDLAGKGVQVFLSSPVRRVAHSGGQVQALGDGFAVTAKRMIMAIPPTLTGRIVYQPLLSQLDGDGGFRDQLVQRLPQGNTIKVQAVYQRPFWRDQGYNGQVTSDSTLCRVTFDNTPYPDDGTPNNYPGVLIGFIEGDDARKFGQMTRAQRRSGVLNSFSTYFGSQALSPISVPGAPDGYVEMPWAEEEFTGGCYGAFFPTGVWTSYGQDVAGNNTLRKPIGLIHWAGTETASVWMGYMDGAVRSGYRAGDEVVLALAQPVVSESPLVPLLPLTAATGMAALAWRRRARPDEPPLG